MTTDNDAPAAGLVEALKFYADPTHWRTANSDGSTRNDGVGLGYHQTGDGIMEVQGSHCGHWVPCNQMVHGGRWQADSGHIARHALAALQAPQEAGVDDGSMTAEEIRLENLKQMAAYSGPIVCFETREPYYLASCDYCGWVGSSEHCGSDSFGDDSDVYCPRCHASGADCGKVAAALSQPVATPAPSQDAAVADVDRLREAAQELLGAMSSTYQARNGRHVGIQADDGEKCWIVHSDQIEALRSALAATRPAEAQAVAEVDVSPTSVLSIASAALSESNNVLMAVHEWQAGSEMLPLDLWTRVRDVLRKAGRI